MVLCALLQEKVCENRDYFLVISNSVTETEST
jgi:hypothetical protein